jgi:hypothetical protein
MIHVSDSGFRASRGILRENWRLRTGISLRALIFTIMGSIAIPLALLALYAISAGAEQEDTRSDEALVLQAGNFATLVDLELGHADALLKGLAASSSLGDGDLDRFEAEMHRVADVNPAEVIALTTPLGELVRTTWPRVQGKSLNKPDTPELLEIATSKRPGTTNLYRAPSGARNCSTRL